MKKVEKYVDAEVKAFKDDIVNIDGIQFLPVSDVKAHIAFAVRKAQIDAIDKLTDEDKIRFLEILLDEIKPVFEIRGVAEDGGKYSEFELKSIKLTNTKKLFDGDNCLSAKVYQEDNCLIQYKNE